MIYHVHLYVHTQDKEANLKDYVKFEVLIPLHPHHEERFMHAWSASWVSLESQNSSNKTTEKTEWKQKNCCHTSKQPS